MGIKSATLLRQSKQREYSARSHLRKLLARGKLEQATAYAKACGLVLDRPDAGGAGVAPAAVVSEYDSLTPCPKTSAKKDSGSGPDTASTPNSDPDAGQPQPSASLLESNREPGLSVSLTDQFPGTLSAPVRISRRSADMHRLAVKWQAFALRIRRNGAHSVMGWEEFEQLQEELGFVAVQEQIVQEVTVKSTVSMEPEIGHDDPPGTVTGRIARIPVNHFMRMVELDGCSPTDPIEVICWVPGYFKAMLGEKVWLCPNEDERGGYVLVGSYGRRGGRTR